MLKWRTFWDGFGQSFRNQNEAVVKREDRSTIDRVLYLKKDQTSPDIGNIKDKVRKTVSYAKIAIFA